MNFESITVMIEQLLEHYNDKNLKSRTTHNVKQILTNLVHLEKQIHLYERFRSGELTEHQFNAKCYDISVNLTNNTCYLADHARVELQLDSIPEGGYEKRIAQSVMDLLRVFAGQNHSGMSAAIVVDLFYKIARFEPVMPLTGNPDEWEEVGYGVWQNKRCGRVFATGPNGEGAYDREGIIFRESNGSCYTNVNSHKLITFPYTPKSEYQNV
jgi:hypothetical protein